VEETLTRFGVEVDKPIEMQADFMHVRSDRLARSAITTKIMLTFIGVLVVGVCASVTKYWPDVAISMAFAVLVNGPSSSVVVFQAISASVPSPDAPAVRLSIKEYSLLAQSFIAF
jgi:hypothetical protein